ncbi:SIS domain-containing protein [Cohnella lubricantis]|uniref:SIS domain-containing protein n=1 Tax=Cohnella lubricantis TaxID=2163172 RepID=A0A841TIN1_9BACL|nr:SIS domain-containing protein [Cohnella lubricantis]MBB6678787.1 SIS domain-containing protein [Cohnella lubricantis]MBP2117870.1 D-sedoheptulose 7-phosphate isomerase [Cohnella lubricantis]
MNPTLDKLVSKYPELEVCLTDIQFAFEKLRDSFNGGGKLLLCGNGGSAADCEHIVGELMKGFMSRRELPDNDCNKLEALFPGEGHLIAEQLQGALPAISLVGATSFWSAYANDMNPEFIFAQQVYGLGRGSDVLLGISTSGNAKNVIRAIQVAKAKGLVTIGLTGRGGGKMASLCDVVIRVPSDSTPDIQERHLPIYHALCILLEEAFFS